MAASNGVLLINLGTPDSPSVKDVRVYLREFLMDGRVIDIPYLKRFLLVNGIIAPTRSFESSKAYQKLWTNEGSPLKFLGLKVRDQLQNELGNDYHVFLAMRYQNPSVESVLKEIQAQAFKRLLIIPLYPQYASASSGSSIEKVLKYLSTWQVIPEFKVISCFYDNPLFLNAFAARGRTYLEKTKYDHILFSYHGLPERQIKKASVNDYCQISDKCCSNINKNNKYCYRAQCYATSRMLAEKLSLKKDTYSVSFQSRLGKDPWIKPYTDDVIKDLCQKGKKKVLVFSPAFIADCLETTVEIQQEYRELFLEHGGERLDLVESLNDSSEWIACLKQMVNDNLSRL